MKKALIALAVLGGLYFAFGKPKNNTPAIDSGTGTTDFFTEFDNQVVVDKDGYHFLVKDGKIFNSATEESYFSWFRNNPGKELITVNQSVWTTYAPTNYGGTY